jgi:hypothetical protein
MLTVLITVVLCSFKCVISSVGIVKVSFQYFSLPVRLMMYTAALHVWRSKVCPGSVEGSSL